MRLLCSTSRLLLLPALALVLAAPMALAEPGDRHMSRREEFRQSFHSSQQNYQRDTQQSQRGEDSSYSETQRQQRFSHEERRQLRRDVQDAGREIYPHRR